MAINIVNEKIRSNNIDLDANYGPYESVPEAHSSLLDNNKNKVGVTVGIKDNTTLTIEEYWYQGGTTEQDLVKKQTAVEVDSTPTQSSPNAVSSGGVYTALQEKAPSTNIQKQALASGIQDSLNKADTALQQHQDISGKADKVNNATDGNFAGLDANGNLTNSTYKAADFATAAQGEKADKAIPMPTGTDGQILEKDSNEASGVKWVNKPSDGKSAYQLYVDGGGTLTQEQWLASLKANIGEFLFVPTDAAAVTAMGTIGQTYSSAIDPQGKNVAPTQNTLNVVLLMNDDVTTPSKTMMIATQDDGNSGYEFVYAGDLQSAMPSNVLTEDNIDNDFAGGSGKVAGADESLVLKNSINELYWNYSTNTEVGGYKVLINGTFTFKKDNIIINRSSGVIAIGVAGNFSETRINLIPNEPIQLNYDCNYLQNVSNSSQIVNFEYLNTNIVAPYQINELNLTPDLLSRLAEFISLDMTSSRLLNNSSNSTFFNISLPKGKKYYITINSDKSFTRFAIFSDSWSSGHNKHDYLEPNVRYEFTADPGFDSLKGYLIDGENNTTITIQLELDSFADTYVPIIPNNSINNDKIIDESVGIEKLNFTTSINLVNLDDPDFAPNKYISNASGSLGNNSSYSTSGFIKVKPNTYYSKQLVTPEDSVSRFRCVLEYDSEKQPITSTYQSSSNGITRFLTSENTAYIRLSFWYNPEGTIKFMPYVHEGYDYIEYSPYRLIIPSEDLQLPDIPDNIAEEVIPVFFLPRNIYVAVGRTIEIYYSQICLNYEKYNIKATCDIGKSLERKYQIIGQQSIIGNHTLTIEVYNDNMKLLASGTSTIHIITDNIASQKKILPIGDSLTNSKPWLNELTNLNQNLVTVGTRQYNDSYPKHEGRSGGTVQLYNNISGSIVYHYDGNYVGVGYDTAPEFSVNDTYSIGDIIKKATIFSNETNGYDYFVYKVVHTPGAFDENECWCCSGGNPFYDFNSGEFSMSFYKTFFNVNYDAIVIYLGTNGINLTPGTNLNGALGIKNLIDNIRVDEPNIPIIVINTIFRGNQNGIGNQNNTDGYSSQAEYKFNADRKVLLLAKSLDEMLTGYTNVYLCPVGFTHDSKYNFGNTKVAVNPRLTNTDIVYELNPLDSVHPQTPGYMQMADEIYSTLCYIYNT